MFLLLTFAFVALLILYLKLKYFTLRGPLPGLSPHFLFGNLIQSGYIRGGTCVHQTFLEFQKRFGDIYQFWLGPVRCIIVSSIGDVQHIFTHRNIYDQSDMMIEQFSTIIPEGLLSLKGQLYFSN